MTRIGGFGGFGRGGKKALSVEQEYSRDALEREKRVDVLSKQDACYDAMTPEQRETNYLKPGLLTRLKKALHDQ